MNKPGKSFMQHMTVCLPWLNIYRCHTQLYARLWQYLSSYSKLVHLFVCGFCLCCVRRSRESRTIPLTWDIMWIYPTRQCSLRLCDRTHLCLTIWCGPDGKTHQNWTCFETCTSLGLYSSLSSNSIPMFRDNQLVPCSRIKMSNKNMSW